MGLLKIKNFFASVKIRIKDFFTTRKIKFTRLLEIIRYLPEEIAASEKEEYVNSSSCIDDFAYISSIGASGLLFIVVFLPLTLVSAKAYELNPIDVLFFAHIPTLLPNESVFDLAYLLYKYHHWPTVFSFGVMYGFLGLAFFPIILLIKRKGWIELIIMSNGLLMGYYFTHLIGSLILKNGANNLGFFKTSYLNFTYILSLYFIASMLIEIFENYGMKAKFEHLFMGTHALFSGWILSRSFKEGSIIFTGFTFLVVSFISIIITEVTLGRFLNWAFGPSLKSAESHRLISLPDKRNLRFKDFWIPFFVFSGLYLGFPFLCFAIFSLIF